MDKVKFMVNRILSKAMRGIMLLGMQGVTITASPKKEGELFTDMHAYSSGQKEEV